MGSFELRVFKNVKLSLFFEILKILNFSFKIFVDVYNLNYLLNFRPFNF